MGETLETVTLWGIAGLIGAGSAIFVKDCIKNQAPTIITENVIGNKTPDRFYYIKGKRAYLEIDGKSVDDYFRSKDQNN